MFAKMDRQKSRLYAAIYGQEHHDGRLDNVDSLNDIHVEWPVFSTSGFPIATWGRMVYLYDACVAEGIHFILAI